MTWMNDTVTGKSTMKTIRRNEKLIPDRIMRDSGEQYLEFWAKNVHCADLMT